MRWALLSLVAGCVPGPDETVAVHGRHIVVYSDPAIPVCEEAVAAADRYVEDVAALLDVSPPAINYYLFDGVTGCGLDQHPMASCEFNGNVYANAWIHYHELAHAVDGTHPPALFVEGFAEAMSWPAAVARGTGLPPPGVALPLESTQFRAGSMADNYRLAGTFVRYLIERFGTKRYRSFAQTVGSLSDRLTIERAFEAAYDRSLADVIASWREIDPQRSSLQLPIDLVDCGDLLAPRAANTWGVDSLPPSTCTSGQTTGGTVYVQPARRYGFEVTEPGMFVIDLVTAGSARVVVWSCTAGSRREYSMPANAAPSMTVPLSPGRHALEVLDGVQAWRIARLGPIGGSYSEDETEAGADDDRRIRRSVVAREPSLHEHLDDRATREHDR